MRRRDYLGSFELMVLVTVMRLGDDAYGVPISTELEAETGHEIAVASVYAALQRLEDKGLVTSRFGDPTPERGGRAKKFFKATGKGIREARNTHRALTRLWRDIPQLEGGHDMKGSGRTMWFLRSLGLDEAVVGDLFEQYRAGRSAGWFWRQVLVATLVSARKHALLLVGAVILGWTVLLVFARFIGLTMLRVNSLLPNALTEPYSAEWWLRSVLVSIVFAAPFFASGWVVEKVAARKPLLPLLTLALSISAPIAIVLIVVARSTHFDLLVWLTVALFLIVAPATAIAAGGFVAARR